MFSFQLLLLLPRIAWPWHLWQTSRTATLPRAAAAAQRTWRATNPGLQLHLWDDGRVRRFVDDNFDGRTRAAFHMLPLGVMRADFFRYAITWLRGGVYADVDVACRRPIATWQPDVGCEVVLGIENNATLCQWTFAAVAGHPLFRLVLEQVVNTTLDGGISTADEHFVHAYTGPGVFSRAPVRFC